MSGRIFLLFLLPFCTHGQLQEMAAEWERDKELKNASIGFCVQDVKTGKTVASYNSHRALVPASTLKVITTGAALGILGSGYRYETKIAYTGSFNKSTGLI